ncbi:MaoC/PaaZ C-terminal domain-containing protein [Chryseobacterium capnotolerans]|uniref:MaoC/PaaZ C-terminal domain-containing protein n=1 Tax=Chryseobacterium capnotolerans TaxID=2759528 RepID=UPI0024B5AEC5|nr:MaoC/PaaZ C-terminal domain-containing protein [Chryseobacterium capnotolerans]
MIINNFTEYKALEGQMVGFSDWHTIDQNQINRFAEATLDDQWIHINEEKAKKKALLHQLLLMAICCYR